MSDTEDVSSAPLRRHHLEKEKDKRRVRFQHLIDPYSAGVLAEWHKKGPSYGVLVDRMVHHCQASGFNPLFVPPEAQ